MTKFNPLGKFKVRICNGEFWTEDDVDCSYLLPEALGAIEEFIDDSLKYGTEYGVRDIELIAESGRVLRVDEARGVAIVQIGEMTAINDHCGALIAAAEMLNRKGSIERLKWIQRKHLDLGHLPVDLYEERHGIYRDLLAFAKARLSPVLYQQFYAAF